MKPQKTLIFLLLAVITAYAGCNVKNENVAPATAAPSKESAPPVLSVSSSETVTSTETATADIVETIGNDAAESPNNLETLTNDAEESQASYKTADDFLNSAEGELFSGVSRSAANALLSADAGELSLYMKNESDAAKATRGLTSVINKVAFMDLLFSLDKIKSDTEIDATYRYALEGEDSLSYVTMNLVKVDGVWKVKWIGIEK